MNYILFMISTFKPFSYKTTVGNNSSSFGIVEQAIPKSTSFKAKDKFPFFLSTIT